MDATFWLDNLLSACAALCGVVLLYGAWLCVTDLVDELRDWVARRLRVGGADTPIAKQKEG